MEVGREGQRTEVEGGELENGCWRWDVGRVFVVGERERAGGRCGP